MIHSTHQLDNVSVVGDQSSHCCIPPEVCDIRAANNCVNSLARFCRAIVGCVAWAIFCVAPTNAEEESSIAWTFEPGREEVGELVGKCKLVDSGPTSPEFQGMPTENRALRITTGESYVRIPDAPDNNLLDFTNGDALTLEAWVRVDKLRDGSFAYIIGKGRTYEDGPKENHNYALRLAGRERGKLAKLSFLFSTSTGEDNGLQYHRWTSNAGFVVDGNWHHVAVSYRFGAPNSIRGFLDGESSAGKWDMGGPTEQPPVVDNDSVWLGSARGGDQGNTLIGDMDNVRLHRQVIPEAQLAQRRIVKPYLPTWPATAPSDAVTVALHEDAVNYTKFGSHLPEESLRFTIPKLALHRLPQKYIDGGARVLWNGPVWLRAFCKTNISAGQWELLLRSPGKSRIWIDGRLVLETPPRRLFPDAHQPFKVYEPDMPWLRVPRVGDHEARQSVTIDESGTHEVVVESLVGSSNSRCELGETLAAIRQNNDMFQVLGPADTKPLFLVDQEFEAYRAQVDESITQLNRTLLAEAYQSEDEFWTKRHRAARTAMKSWATEESLPASLDEAFASAADPDTALSDLAFLRRVHLDTVGVPPTKDEIDAYLQTAADLRRTQAVDRLLDDARWADHWTSYWQDVLAENPNILKPSLNNTGPFRLWIHDALSLNMPVDRFVTELLRMRGDSYAGAAAGFGQATQNDVPMAEKAHVIASAFLGVDMKCARCHDAPYHPWTQKDLFQIGAMLDGKPIKVPATSSVPAEFFERKQDEDSPISLSLAVGQMVQPKWPEHLVPADEFGAEPVSSELVTDPSLPREHLAAMITRGENRRFAEVIANRLWLRLMGWGLQSSADDWLDAESVQPNVLRFLAADLVTSGYDMKHVARTILLSDIYQRPSIDESLVKGEARFHAPWQRRMTAEQIVDSLHSVTGRPMKTEAITFDPEASQKLANFLNLGVANRAWQLTSMANERDRPSLSLPKAASVVECLEAFGWRPLRHAPVTQRETEANMIQAGVLANGNVTTHVTRLTDDSPLTDVAWSAESPDSLVETLFMTVLTRQPTESERDSFLKELSVGFANRRLADSDTVPQPPASRGFVTWSNHFDVRANQLMRDLEREVADGPTPTGRLQAHWRERVEDATWALLNSPEFQMIP